MTDIKGRSLSTVETRLRILLLTVSTTEGVIVKVFLRCLRVVFFNFNLDFMERLLL
jgi:hypothetical protein